MKVSELARFPRSDADLRFIAPQVSRSVAQEPPTCASRPLLCVQCRVGTRTVRHLHVARPCLLSDDIWSRVTHFEGLCATVSTPRLIDKSILTQNSLFGFSSSTRAPRNATGSLIGNTEYGQLVRLTPLIICFDLFSTPTPRLCRRHS